MTYEGTLNNVDLLLFLNPLSFCFQTAQLVSKVIKLNKKIEKNQAWKNIKMH